MDHKITCETISAVAACKVINNSISHFEHSVACHALEAVMGYLFIDHHVDS